jgi:DNA-binding Lrp family transcriptional regulator
VVTLESLSDRLHRLVVAGLIVCVAFVLSLGAGITVEQVRAQHDSTRNRQLIARLQADEGELARQQRASRVISCQDTNGVKRGAYAYIQHLTTRSVAANEALIASRNASPQQKAAARLSLASITANLHEAAVAFAVKDCAKIGAN